MKIETKPFDAAEFLESDDDIAGYLAEALATGEPAVISRALAAAARARGLGEAAHGDVPSGSMSEALATNNNPELATVLRVIKAIGLRLTVERLERAA